MNEAIYNPASEKAAAIDTATAQFSTLLETTKSKLHDAVVAAREATYQQGIADIAAESESKAFRGLAGEWRESGMIIEWYDGNGTYSAIADMLKTELGREYFGLNDRKNQFFTDKTLGRIEYKNREVLAAFLADSTTGMDDKPKAMRGFAQAKTRSIVSIMSTEHAHLDGVETLEGEYDIYLQAQQDTALEKCNGDAKKVAKYMADHPVETFGKPKTRWATDHKAIAAYLAARKREDLGIIAPSQDIAGHLSGINKILDKTVGDNREYDIAGDDRVSMRTSLSNVRKILERNLPRGWDSKSESARLVTLLADLPE